MTVQSFITIKWQEKKLPMIKVFNFFVFDQLKSEFYQHSVLTKKKFSNDLSQFASVQSLHTTYLWKKLVTIEIFLLNFFWGEGVKMCNKMATSAYIFEKSRKGPIFKA